MAKRCVLYFVFLFYSLASPAQVPPNDDCSGAVTLTVDGPTVSGTTINATGPYTQNCGGATDDDVWYSFVATAPQLRINITPDTSGGFTPINHLLYEIFSGTDCNNLVFLDCAYVYWSTVLTKRTYPFTLGATYFIKIYSAFDNIADRGKFKVNIISAPWAANLRCLFATTLTPSLSTTPNFINGSTLNGFFDQSYCTNYYYSEQNVWYDFTVNSRHNRIKILQDNPPSNIYATVFLKDCSASSPVVRSCSTDSVISLTDFMVGEEISIKLNSRSTNVNNQFKIGVYTDSLANDECASAIPLVIDSNAYKPGKYYTTLDATQSFIACDTSIPIKDIWFKITAGTLPFEIVIDNMNCDVESQFYSGTCGSLTSLICQKRDNIIIPQSFTPGTVYYLRVYGLNSTLPLQFIIKAFIIPGATENSLVDTVCLLPNLVYNPGFEIYTSCPVGFTEVATPGGSLIPGWNFPTLGTSDYFNNCTIFNSSVHVPRNNCTGKQIPRRGKGYAGIFCFANGSNQREYLGGTLNSPLIPGRKYLVSYWVNLSDAAEFGLNRLGVYFTTSPFTLSTFLPIPVTPQLTSPFALFFTDKEKWVNVSAVYIPDQPYTNFIIGNFFNDTATHTLHTPYTKNGGGDIGCDIYNGSMLLIDDVTIAEIIGIPQCTILPITMLSFNAVKSGVSAVKLEWKTTNESNIRSFEIERGGDGVHFVTIGTVVAKNNNGGGVNTYKLNDDFPLPHTNYYRLKIKDFNGIYSYSDIRVVNFDSKTPFDLFPNPFRDHFSIYFGTRNGSYVVNDINGRLIQSGGLSGGLNHISTITWPTGMYFINLFQPGKFAQIQKIVKF